MRLVRRFTALLLIGVILASCGGPSPWEVNQDRMGHQKYLSEASNQDVLIESYNEKYDRLETIDDCEMADLDTKSTLFSYGVTLGAVDAGETTNRLGGPLARDLDRTIGQVLALADWMSENYCPGISG